MTPSASTGPDEVPVTVVIVTRDRWQSLLRTLTALEGLPERPAIIVVDNASADPTLDRVARRHPGVRALSAGRNAGGAGRNLGVRAAGTPYVAFSDDDSWWEAGALRRAAATLDRHPALAVVAGAVLVGPEGRLDPTCVAMAASPLARPTGRAGCAGPRVLGFLACGAVVRRSAYLAVGGFHPRFGVGGEEELLAVDLARAGWGLCYVPSVVARHHPARAARNPARRERVQLRNALWAAWLRRPLPTAARRTVRLLAGPGPGVGIPAAVEATRGLPWVVRERRVVPPAVERDLRALEDFARKPGPRSAVRRAGG